MDRETLLSYARVCGFIGLTSFVFYNSCRKSKLKQEKQKAVVEKRVSRNNEICAADAKTCEYLRLGDLDEQNYVRLCHITERDSSLESVISPLLGDGQSVSGRSGFMPDRIFTSNQDYVLAKTMYRAKVKFDATQAPKLILGGPRMNLYRDPKKVRACIVTCGGLCPGLNVIIRELVMSLHYNYNCPNPVMGVVGGYEGFYERELIELTPELVRDLHRQGGTFLKTSRGSLQVERVCDSIESKGFNMVFCVGGDGSHRGIMEIVKEFEKRGSNITVWGIPKTIDNDIPIIDKSFGFDTSVEEAQRAIDSANVEATSVDLGVGLVRLFGRHSGFIAMAATQSNRDVNLCIIPEAAYNLEGEYGYYEWIKSRLEKRRHCVIVVAEGAASGCIDKKEELQPSGQTDPSGNAILVDIGTYLKKEIPIAMKARGLECTLKYLDPTYMIRTVPANSSDRILCTMLANATVHGAFAGFTNFSTGIVAGKTVYIPIELLTQFVEGKEGKPGQRRVDTDNDIRWWRCLSGTGQPVFGSEN